eukprot:scaffold79765_cov45-Phaeocystis_antarctica.AAC.1
MTGRSPIALFDELEEEFSCDFDEISPDEMAQPNAGWPAHAARIVRDLVSSSRGACLVRVRVRVRVRVSLLLARCVPPP